MTFETLRHLPAAELREGDWPISIAGFRPIQRIRKFPRKRRVDCWIDGQRYTLQAADTIGKVRRPLDSAAAFDPFAALNRAG